jgi:5-methylcytosine-specific restriction endonuclease McrA
MEPSHKDYWRALILYGRYSSTYKLAVGKLLGNYAVENRERIELDEFSSDFIDLYLDRCSTGKPQLGFSGRKTIVEKEVDAINFGIKNKSDSIEKVKRNALLNMVLQRFNTLNWRRIRKPFYSITENERYLVLGSNLLCVFSSTENYDELLSELSSRWDLIEHAYERIHEVESLDVDEYLKHLVKKEKRTPLTHLIPTLNGYQQGRCFYCGEQLYEIEVDHVIPYHALMHNEIWNLVLSHHFCNQNKSDNLPPRHFIENLIERNEFLISSSHPLKDTLIRELGNTKKMRLAKTIQEYKYAKGKIGRIWEGNNKYDPQQDGFYRGWVRFLGSGV